MQGISTSLSANPEAFSVGASDLIAALALIVSSGAFFLEVRRWFESGANLHISLMADAIEMPAPPVDKPMLVLSVTNRGDTPTTITHMICVARNPRWKFWRERIIMNGIVNTIIQPLPFELGVNRTWMGRLNYDERLLGFRAKGQLYVGVIASHSNKYFLKRVPKEKPDIPTDKVGAS